MTTDDAPTGRTANEERGEKILAALEDGALTVKDLTAVLDVSAATVSKAIAPLLDNDLVVRCGTGGAASPFIYGLAHPPEARCRSAVMPADEPGDTTEPRAPVVTRLPAGYADGPEVVAARHPAEPAGDATHPSLMVPGEIHLGTRETCHTCQTLERPRGESPLAPVISAGIGDGSIPRSAPPASALRAAADIFDPPDHVPDPATVAAFATVIDQLGKRAAVARREADLMDASAQLLIDLLAEDGLDGEL